MLGKRGEVFQGVDGKIQVLRGGPGGAERSQKTNIKPIYRGDCLKRGAWTVCRIKGGLASKKGVVFLRGG